MDDLSIDPSKAKIVITGGGTGGHLYPALAVAEALQDERPGLDLLFIGRDSERERKEVERRNIPFYGFPLKGLRRQITPSNICALWRFMAAFWQCRSLLKRCSPGVVFGVGGYVSAPAMTAGKRLGWKVALHEQNTIPGLVNRFLASHCDRVFATFESSVAHFSGADCMVTGLPLRREILNALDRRAPRGRSEVPFVLLTGGSQGARKMVEAALQAFQQVKDRGLVFRARVQTGERNFEWALSLPRPKEVELAPFIHDMASAYEETDLIVARAGSGSLSEIALWGIPSILIPYPFASENHQRENARSFENAGAAWLIEESTLTPESLAEAIVSLLRDKARRESMKHSAASLARRDAARTIAQELLRLLAA